VCRDILVALDYLEGCAIGVYCMEETLSLRLCTQREAQHLSEADKLLMIFESGPALVSPC
jgi:hypothetical protein